MLRILYVALLPAGSIHVSRDVSSTSAPDEKVGIRRI
jgi:hypothetical protein